MNSQALTRSVTEGTPLDCPPWPVLPLEAVAAATRVLQSGKLNYWTGPEGRAFEKEFAEHCNRRYAVALANGSVALELALLVLGIGRGDEVIVSPRTFVASASSIPLAGAVPIFADIDRDSQNITAATIRPAITARTKAIIVVHLAGWPADMDPILELAAAHNLFVIEDCAQAHGARYKGRPVGSMGHLAAFSFCQEKIISTGGEGGMLLLDSYEQFTRAWSYKDHGKDFEATQSPFNSGEFRWIHHTFGTNWRLTEVQSAIGRVLLQKLPEYVADRRRNARILAAALGNLPLLRIPLPATDDIYHSHYRLYAFLNRERLATGWDRGRLLRELTAAGVPCNVGSCGEVYRERSFVEAGYQPATALPNAAEIAETAFCFLVHPSIDEPTIQRVAQVAAEILKLAGA